MCNDPNPVWIFKMLWEACCCNCYGRGRALLLPALCGKSCSAASRLPRNGVQLLGFFRGWTMPILPKRATCFLQMKVKNFRRLSRKISRWDKDESSRLTVTTVWLQVTEAIQIIHFFFVRLLHVALFRRLAFGTKPLAIRKRCSQHHLGRSRG